jgi:hypothetical protein
MFLSPLQLPHTIKAEYAKIFGAPPSDDILTHLKRELMQAIWMLLLGPEFTVAYTRGIIILCADGVQRLVFPRFFSYTADYPERCALFFLQLRAPTQVPLRRVLLVCIKFLANCPCPLCFTTKDQVPESLGTIKGMHRRRKICQDDDTQMRTVERARKWIFEKGIRLGSDSMKRLLGPFSWTATRVCASFLQLPFHPKCFSERIFKGLPRIRC